MRKSNLKKIKWMPLPRSEKAEALYNPYCGLYSIYRFYADSDLMFPEEIEIEKVELEKNQQICLVEINLVHFNEKPISEEALCIIKRIFQYFSSKEKQMIVRFVYDWEGKGILNEPKDAIIIERHMEQLSFLLKEYGNSIYILQGLFIGSWGEMHNSRYLSERHMTRLAKQLYACSAENTQIALRCPSFWRMVFKTDQPLDASTAYINIQKARFALFNDGMMASETDFGTYGNILAREATTHSDKWVRQDELDFQNELCKYVTNGGEVINECPYNDIAPAIETLRKMRVSYLHCIYDEKVIDKWKACKSGINNAVWKDKSGFDYIAAHLGYRFRIEDASVSLSSDKNGSLRILLKISNIGFSPCYHKFEVKIVIRTASFSEIYEYGIDTDTRMWMPQEKVELESIVPIEEMEQKNYILCFGIFDPRSQHPIQIANTFSTADHSGNYNLGNFIFE